MNNLLYVIITDRDWLFGREQGLGFKSIKRDMIRRNRD